MINPTFDSLVQAITPLLGASKVLVSGTGERFTSSSKGKATAYHSNLAPGNQAEIAIDISSNASRLGITDREMRDRITQARASTGRDVEINVQYNWPRIGLSSQEHIQYVLSALSKPHD